MIVGGARSSAPHARPAPRRRRRSSGRDRVGVTIEWLGSLPRLRGWGERTQPAVAPPFTKTVTRAARRQGYGHAWLLAAACTRNLALIPRKHAAQGRHGGLEIARLDGGRGVLAAVAEHELVRGVGRQLGAEHPVGAPPPLPLVGDHAPARVGGIAAEQILNLLEGEPHLGHERLPARARRNHGAALLNGLPRRKRDPLSW